jgi:hypothetical protein
VAETHLGYAGPVIGPLMDRILMACIPLDELREHMAEEGRNFPRLVLGGGRIPAQTHRCAGAMAARTSPFRRPRPPPRLGETLPSRPSRARLVAVAVTPAARSHPSVAEPPAAPTGIAPREREVAPSADA